VAAATDINCNRYYPVNYTSCNHRGRTIEVPDPYSGEQSKAYYSGAYNGPAGSAISASSSLSKGTEEAGLSDNCLPPIPKRGRGRRRTRRIRKDERQLNGENVNVYFLVLKIVQLTAANCVGVRHNSSACVECHQYRSLVEWVRL